MKILYFGSYDPSYSRNRILISGLSKNNVEVLRCTDNTSGIKKFINLFKKHWHLRNSYDVIVVGFLGQQIVPFVKLITKKPIIFDAFVSLYDSNVFDRKVVKAWSVRAWYYWFLDWISMSLADLVLFDTNQHIDYAVKEFKIRKDKFRRIFVGTDDAIFYPKGGELNSKFIVHFHGSFIPLQGIECIIKAAKFLEDEEIEFNIVGNGQTHHQIMGIAKELEIRNINFINHINYDKLPEYINKSNICLGIFGQTSKAGRVIPNKIYEYVAMKKPVITTDTLAIRELFNDNDMVLIPPNSKDLALAILNLKNNLKLGQDLAESAYFKFSKYATPDILGLELKNIAISLLK